MGLYCIMSISQAQAAALADGFVDSQGESKTNFAPRKTYTELFVIAGELIGDAQKNLNSSNKISSGALSSSLLADEPTQSGSIVRIDIRMNFYGRFVNKGVKGLRGGNSTANYRFRTPNPSENMVKAIAVWVKRAGLKSVSTAKYKPYGKHDTKNRNTQDLLAYSVAYMVKQKGLKPTGFLDKAVTTTKSKLSSRLGAALRIDVIDSMKQF